MRIATGNSVSSHGLARLISVCRIEMQAVVGALNVLKLGLLFSAACAQVFRFEEREYTVAESGSPVEVCVETPSYPGNAPDEITLSLTVTDNDATAGVDYIDPSTTLTFSSEMRSQCVDVTIMDDDVVEENESFNFSITSPSSGIVNPAMSSTVFTIIDDDTDDNGGDGNDNNDDDDGNDDDSDDTDDSSDTSDSDSTHDTDTESSDDNGDSDDSNNTDDDTSVSVGFSSPAYEGREGENSHVCVTLSGETEMSFTVTLSVNDSSTATEGVDYNAPLPAEINTTTMDSVCYTISLMTDNMLDGNETIHLQLSSAESFVSFTQDSAIITIIDSTEPPQETLANMLEEIQRVISFGEQTGGNVDFISMNLNSIIEVIDRNNITFREQRQTFENLTSTLGALLENWPEEILQSSQPSSLLILDAIESLGRSILAQISTPDEISLCSDGFYLLAKKVFSSSGFDIRLSSDRCTTAALNATSVSFPEALFSDGEEINILFTLYRSASLFPDNSSSNLTVSSSVVGIIINNLSQLTKNITIQFQLQNGSNEIQCVFYDFDTSQWLPDGCITMVNVTGEVTCICNHLTNFAVRTSQQKLDCGIHSNNNGFVCVCNSGYVLESDGKTCSDVNECANGDNGCSRNAICTNTVGSYSCMCKNGFSGDGTTCIDIDECSSATHNCHENAECLNGIGSFSCICRDGYRGNGYHCVDEGFCDESSTQSVTYGNNSWPQASVESIEEQPCDFGPDNSSVTRKCMPRGQWSNPDYSNCYTMITMMYQDIDVEGLDEERIVEITMQFAALVGMTPVDDQSQRNFDMILSVLSSIRRIVLEGDFNDTELGQITLLVAGIIDDLQSWQDGIYLRRDINAVEILETVAGALAVNEEIEENEEIAVVLNFKGEMSALFVERVDTDILQMNGREFGVEQQSGGLNTMSPTMGAEKPLASVQLPGSLFTTDSVTSSTIGGGIGLVFSFFETPVLFPLPNGTRRDIQIRSSVIGALLGGVASVTDLVDPVVITLPIEMGRDEEVEQAACVSWDFDALDGYGGWTDRGCTAILDRTSNTMKCYCNHLTNFAALVDVCSRTEGDCQPSGSSGTALEVLSYVGVTLSIVGLILTIITMLSFRKLRSRDASKFHVQLSLALLGMLLVFVVGIDRTETFGGCVTASVLIHYFTLVAVMWMGAEALLLFKQLIIVFVQITTRYIVIVSLVCWLAPLLPVIISVSINPQFMVSYRDSPSYGPNITTERELDFCFIGEVGVFFGAFLLPILIIVFFNSVIFVMVTKVLIKHSRKIYASEDKRKIDGVKKLFISTFGIMFIFGMSWVFGALTISEASETFQYLFTIFTSLQGFFIFLFFCVLGKEARKSWTQLLCRGCKLPRFTSTSSSQRKTSSSKGTGTTRTFGSSGKPLVMGSFDPPNSSRSSGTFSRPFSSDVSNTGNGSSIEMKSTDVIITNMYSNHREIGALLAESSNNTDKMQAASKAETMLDKELMKSGSGKESHFHSEEQDSLHSITAPDIQDLPVFSAL